MTREEKKRKRILSGTLAKQVSAYSVAAGAALVMVAPSEATVYVHTPAKPLTINGSNSVVGLDLDGDGQIDFNLSMPGSASSAKAVKSAGSSNMKVMKISPYGSNFLVETKRPIKNSSFTSTLIAPKKLAAGAPINIVSSGTAGNLMSIGASYISNTNTNSYAPPKVKRFWGKLAQFNKGASGYIGVTFVARDGLEHTGWIHFTGGSSVKKLSGVIDKWAYEDWPNYPIKAGAATSIPRIEDITASAGPNGSIQPKGDVKVKYDGSREFKFKGNKGYGVADVQVDGVSVGSAISNYTLERVEAPHTISVSFTKYPIANAGPVQTVTEQTTVTLNGENSSDPNGGNITSYAWKQIKGPSVVLIDPSAAITTFDAPDVGPGGKELVFQLTVTDSVGLTATSDCTVHVTWVNQPPVAVAGPDQIVQEDTTVTLNGKGSSDPDDGIKSYKWSQLNGTPVVKLVNAGTPVAKFKAPNEVDVLEFQLKVTDKHGLSSTDTCLVNVASGDQSATATAKPGKNQIVNELATVLLDGSASGNPEDDTASYLWEQVSGPPVTLSEANTSKATFTAPDLSGKGAALVFRLTVTDAHGLQSSGKCTVKVK